MCSPVLRWSGDGRSIVVLVSPKVFEEAGVLKKYFNHNRYKSFVRQLNNYGFEKIKIPEDGHDQFFHSCFVKGRRELLANITRGGSRRPSLEEDTEEQEENIEVLKGTIEHLQNQLSALKMQMQQMNVEVDEESVVSPIPEDSEVDYMDVFDVFPNSWASDAYENPMGSSFEMQPLQWQDDQQLHQDEESFFQSVPWNQAADVDTMVCDEDAFFGLYIDGFVDRPQLSLDHAWQESSY